MSKLGIFTVATLSLSLLGATLPARPAAGQQTPPAAVVERINAASQSFIAAIGARDLPAMERLWAHQPYATFIGPLSTTVVVGWDGVRKAWEMRFGQFDRVTISLAESHVHSNGKVAWAVGVEKVELLRKNGETLAFDAFVTNVFEQQQDGRWLVVSHHATPIFREAK